LTFATLLMYMSKEDLTPFLLSAIQTKEWETGLEAQFGFRTHYILGYILQCRKVRQFTSCHLEKEILINFLNVMESILILTNRKSVLKRLNM